MAVGYSSPRLFGTYATKHVSRMDETLSHPGEGTPSRIPNCDTGFGNESDMQLRQKGRGNGMLAPPWDEGSHGEKTLEMEVQVVVQPW